MPIELYFRNLRTQIQGKTCISKVTVRISGRVYVKIQRQKSKSMLTSQDLLKMIVIVTTGLHTQSKSGICTRGLLSEGQETHK
jgi:hypothetical protein